MRPGRRTFLSAVLLLPGLVPSLVPHPVLAETEDVPSLRFDDLYLGNGILGATVSERTMALAGRRVAMRGYMAPPLKTEGGFFVLTRRPVDLCPFCNSDADWPLDIVVVYPADDAEFVRNTVPIEVTGILQVGPAQDPKSGFYSRLRLVRATFRSLA